MTDHWHFTQRNERQGPVSFDRLQKMAREGWLHPTALVWHAGLPDWIPAEQVQGLFPMTVTSVIQKTWQQISPDQRDAPATDASRDADAAPPPCPTHRPEKSRKKRALQAKATQVAVDWNDLSPRHLVAALGGFLAALGVAFTAIAQSRLSLAFTLGGLLLVVFGLSVEVARVLAQALDNVGRVLQEASEKRVRARELALEKQRLDLEAQRLAEQDKALAQSLTARPVEVPVPGSAFPASVEGATGGNTIVINQPPVRLWSPGLAAVLSFFMPGLGQLYKGQFFNAVAWFFVVLLGYGALIIPGLILHFFCVLGALSGNPWTEDKTTVVRQ